MRLMVEQLVAGLQSQIDAIMHFPWRTSDMVWQRWGFWILATLPLVLLIEIHNLVGGLLDSNWRTSRKQWQRSCFWIMLVLILLLSIFLLILVIPIWLLAK